MSPPSPRKMTEADEKERDALKKGLKSVGENLPHDPVEVEGADVDRIVRHKQGEAEEEESEDAFIEDTLKHPHPDVDREVVDEMDLDEED